MPEQDRQKLESIDSLLHHSYELTQQEKYDEALPFAEEALSTARQLSVSNDTVLSSCVYQLAVVYSGKKDLARAEKLYRQALELAEHDSYDQIIAASAHGLADLYYKEKELDKAKVLYERALPIWQRLGGTDHQGAIAALNRLAQIALSQKHFDQAENLIRRALQSEEKL